jgi:hypothetical protein
MSVGALDAFFCDAYGDLIARTLRAKQYQPAVHISDKIKTLKVPISVVLTNRLNEGWLWRMVARDLIEKDNVLSITKIKDLFNHFFRTTNKLFASDSQMIDRWIKRQHSQHRIFGLYRTAYVAASPQMKTSMKKRAVEHLESRFRTIFQRRHDCIHNCDRPKIAIQINNIKAIYVGKVIEDIEYLVNRCTEEFRSEFPIYLTGLGFSGIAKNRVLA